MNKVKRAALVIGNGLIGVVFGFVTVLALSPGLAAFPALHHLTWVVLALVIVLCAFAPTVRRGFGRGFLASGAALFVLPLSGLLLSGAAFTEVVGDAAPEDAAFTAIGAGLAAGAVTTFAGVVGLILGTLFLIVGLVLSLGGQREVRVIDRR